LSADNVRLKGCARSPVPSLSAASLSKTAVDLRAQMFAMMPVTARVPVSVRAFAIQSLNPAVATTRS
jgi:hypothetical protein